MSGFVYIWRDKKHNRYYIGCHWGTEDDGYICSSTWMRNSYKRRPDDFKRRILSRVSTSRTALFEKEQEWLNLIKENEIKIRYYNLCRSVKNLWHQHEDANLRISQKISKTLTGHKQSEETKRKRAESIKKAWASGRMQGMRGKTHSDEYKARLSVDMKGPATNNRRRGIQKAWDEGRMKGTTGMKLPRTRI